MAESSRDQIGTHRPRRNDRAFNLDDTKRRESIHGVVRIENARPLCQLSQSLALVDFTRQEKRRAVYLESSWMRFPPHAGGRVGWLTGQPEQTVDSPVGQTGRDKMNSTKTVMATMITRDGDRQGAGTDGRL